MWRLVTRISPALRDSKQQKRLADDLLWLGLLLGLAALVCFNANLHAGHGLNLLILTLAGLSALLLGGGVALDRRAVRSRWRRPR
ncbi:MAG: hypothetical protein KDD82_08845 [Planctomycetes bacterium]|nr:hypothetical protein [Planctomycetota bacterium]